MAVKPYQWGLDQKKDKWMTDVINQGRKQYGAEKFDAILESQYGIKKSDYMGDSYNKLVSTAQTGGKQAVDKLYKTNTSSITSSQSRNPITTQSNP